MSRHQADVILVLFIWASGLLVGFGFGYVAGRGKGKMEAYEAIEAKLIAERQRQEGER